MRALVNPNGHGSPSNRIHNLLIDDTRRRWFDHRRGLLAAWICASYPTLIAFTHYLWSETLFILLLLLAIWQPPQTSGVN